MADLHGTPLGKCLVHITPVPFTSFLLSFLLSCKGWKLASFLATSTDAGSLAATTVPVNHFVGCLENPSH